MTYQIEETTLMQFLKTKNLTYYGKVFELREAVQGWLSYIYQTFPHYPRHTIEHSEEIISQISKMLFKDSPDQCVVSLSATEAYILLAASYLHDAGMVTSDKEKKEIITSSSWKEWTTGQGGGAKRLAAVQDFRNGFDPADETLRNFLADIQIRFLIAEFIRRTHHYRSKTILSHNQSALGRFAFDNRMLLNTISNVCLSHGLRPYELRDNGRYPDRCDIKGEPVNVRFMAILLRVGDLLDMSYDRACPLLLNAACPLPPDSFAHWSQYDCFTHLLTAHDRIEIRAECQNQEEHRVIQDWCQWLVEELHEAGNIMAHANRHSSWTPPKAEIGDAGPTITIQPAPNATYIPS